MKPSVWFVCEEEDIAFESRAYPLELFVGLSFKIAVVCIEGGNIPNYNPVMNVSAHVNI